MAGGRPKRDQSLEELARVALVRCLLGRRWQRYGNETRRRDGEANEPAGETVDQSSPESSMALKMTTAPTTAATATAT